MKKYNPETPNKCSENFRNKNTAIQISKCVKNSFNVKLLYNLFPSEKQKFTKIFFFLVSTNDAIKIDQK